LDNAKKLDAQKKEQDAEKLAILVGNKAAARESKKKK
jgi:hypothetical protein